MTADVPVTAAAAAPSRLVLPSYGRPCGVHPPLDYAGYRSTALRSEAAAGAAVPEPGATLRFDIRLQGDNETVFFDV